MTSPVAGRTFIFVSSHVGPSMGRMNRRLLKVMTALVEAGATVRFVCTPGSPAADVARTRGIHVAVYPLDKFNYVRTRSRLRKYMKRYEPVLVHSTGRDADFLARWAVRPLHTPLVSSVLDMTWPPRGGSQVTSRLRRYIEEISRAHVDAFIVDSQTLASRLIAEGVSDVDVLIDPPSVDLARVSREADVDPELSDEALFPRPLVGYAGSFAPARGAEILVQAARILGRNIDATTLLAGRGTAEIAARAGTAAVPDLRVLGTVASVPAVLKALDVCIFPSVGPGTPTSLLEAAALGRPIVASRVPGIRELFTDGVEITLIEPGDPAALAAAVASLLADPTRAAALGAAARHRCIDEYSSRASVERHFALYGRFLHG